MCEQRGTWWDKATYDLDSRMGAGAQPRRALRAVRRPSGNKEIYCDAALRFVMHLNVRLYKLVCLEPRRSLRYGRESVFRAHVGPTHDVELTPGSGPRRTPRRGAAGPDASSPRSSRLPRVRVQSPHTPPAQAVEDAPDAHGGQRRPSRARVCCRTRAQCAALRAAPRTGLHIM
ncbi:hypothetical protein EVAR_38474_1 [Eumeta japonica]|uniref:Uncharacterized protein n=1 Tax=Eumeta variegata TaxID=151549 RepID=A0A4C1WLN0_EUMVA|nr:hypothetical protein EVAR_38474_1 [Eumeta japonica]